MVLWQMITRGKSVLTSNYDEVKLCRTKIMERLNYVSATCLYCRKYASNEQGKMHVLVSKDPRRERKPLKQTRACTSSLMGFRGNLGRHYGFLKLKRRPFGNVPDIVEFSVTRTDYLNFQVMAMNGP